LTEAPDAVAIRARGRLDATVRVPGSRSLTNRALLAAALARGESRLAGALHSDDTEAMCDCLGALGVAVDAACDPWRVAGAAGRLRTPDRTLDVRMSGTTARFITAAATLADGPARIDGARRMRERPIRDLADALAGLGARIHVEGAGGCPPVRTEGAGLAGGSVVIDASRSSQYVSAVLLAAPCARSDVVLRLKDGVLVSRPYVAMTLQVMEAFGADAGWAGDDTLWVRAGHPYRGCDYTVEPDASSASYPFAAAAITGGRVRVEGLSGRSVQADVRFLDALEAMGCDVVRGEDFCEVRAPQAGLTGIDVDAGDFPDACMTLAVVAAFARGPTRIRNVANLRIKESDRLAGLESELRKLGADVRAGADDLSIRPGPLRGAALDTYDDHRMAMALSLAGLRVPGVVIRDPDCVRKTWPDWFATLERL